MKTSIADCQLGPGPIITPISAALSPRHPISFERVGRLGAFCLMLLLGGAWAEEPEATEIRLGDCRATFSWQQGVTLSYRGLPIITRSTLSVQDQGSQTVYCHLGRVRPKIRTYKRGPAVVLEAAFPPDRSDPEAQELPFYFEYVLRLEPENRVQISFRYGFRREEPAVLDYCIGRFLDTLFVGQPYQVKTEQGTRTRKFPWLPPPPGNGSYAVAPNLQRLTVTTPLCDLAITVLPGSDSPTLYDSRDQYMAAFSRGSAVWLGVQKSLAGKTFGHCTVALEFRQRQNSPLPSPGNGTERPVLPPAEPEYVSEAILPARGGPFRAESGEPTPALLSLANHPQVRLPWTSSNPMESPEKLAAIAKLIYDQPLAVRYGAPVGKLRLIPRPQRLTRLDRDFVWNARTTMVLAPDISPQMKRCLEDLIEEFAARYGQRLLLAQRESWAEIPPQAIVVGTARDALWSHPPRSVSGRPLRPRRSEGYILEVQPERVLLCGRDERGLFYGLQTLRQLCRIGEFDEITFSGVSIEDWPDLEFRGVHLFADDHALSWHKELIHAVFAPLKINTLVLECEYAHWNSHPEIAPEWAMTQEEMRELRDYAQAHFIQVIPLIQTLGHCGWMFHNGQHLDLAEDPDFPYAYCISNPETYDLVFDVLGEAIDLFRPKYLHIGHDEVHHRGRFPHCRRCRLHKPGDLLVRDVNKLHDFLTQRNVRTMMWGDLLLRPEEASDAAHGGGRHGFAQARERLPREIIICDWHYGTFDRYPSLSLFRSEGFDVVGACWLNPENIVGLSRAARKARAWGLLQTTWTGYDGNREAPRQHYDQLAAYILAAEYAWSVDQPPLAELNYQPGEVLAHLTTSHYENHPRVGYLLDLKPYCNISFGNRPRKGWVGAGWAHDLSHLPTGVLRLGQVLFRIPSSSNPGTGEGIMLAGLYTSNRALPEAVSIPFTHPVQQLVFLHTCGWKTTCGRRVGNYEITYQDGAREEIELIYGYNITAWNDPIPTFRAHLAWKGHTRGGADIALRALTWDNPHPAKPLARITLRSLGTEASPTLLSITAVE